jgi:PPOX class probable F420-dependent enzyme
MPPWAEELLRTARIAHLGTADAAGRPLVVPVCYAFDGERCYSAIDRKPKRAAGARLRRLRNIADNPRVSLVVDRYEEDWTRLAYVIVEGRADVLTGGPDYTRGVELLVAKYPQYGALALDREAGLLVRIVADRFIPWRYA